MAQKAKALKENSQPPTKKSRRTDKLSLHLLQFEDALAAVLSTPPPPKPAKTKAKPQAKKR